MLQHSTYAPRSRTAAIAVLCLLLSSACSTLPQPAHAQDLQQGAAHSAIKPEIDNPPDEPQSFEGPIHTAAPPVVSLEPYFPSSAPYFRAAQLYEDGSCSKALKIIQSAQDQCSEPCDARNALDLLQAKILLCDGKHAQALALLDILVKRGYPGMNDEVRASYEQAARRLKRPTPWDGTAHIANPPAKLRAPSIKRAQRLAKSKDLDKAITEYERVLDARPAKNVERRVLLSLARTAISADDPIAASRYAYRAWRRDLRRAKTPEELLVQLAAQHPELDGLTRLTVEDALDRLEVLARTSKKGSSSKKKAKRSKKKAKRRSRKGRKRKGRKAKRRSVAKSSKTTKSTGGDAYLKHVQTTYLTTPRDRKAAELWVQGHKKEARRDRKEALALFEEAAKLASHPALRVRIDTGRALALRRLGKDDQAITLYTEAANQLPHSAVAPESLYQAARLSTYKHQHAQANTLLLRLLSEYPHTEHRDEALWMLGWSSWMTQNTDRALAVFQHIAKHHPHTRDLSGIPARARALYWQARSHARLGQTFQAQELFQEVFRTWPLSYYAALSAHQLKALGATVPSSAYKLDTVQSLVQPKNLTNANMGFTELDPRIAKGIELLRLGYSDKAQTLLQQPLRRRQSPNLCVELHALKKLDSGDLPSSFWLASRYGDFDRAPHPGNARLWALAYPAPAPYQTIAKEVGKELETDPMLAFAIMRHESGFDTSARSNVGAVGLMQIMPDSAQAAYRLVLGEKGPSRKKLASPKTNIRTGMMLLYMMNNYFRGNLPLAIGAYNAGSGIAERWFKQYRGLDTDLVVELMTYPKTAAYVKKVLSSYYAYRVLYGDGTPPPIPLTLPESTGDWTRSTPQGPMSQR